MSRTTQHRAWFEGKWLWGYNVEMRSPGTEKLEDPDTARGLWTSTFSPEGLVSPSPSWKGKGSVCIGKWDSKDSWHPMARTYGRKLIIIAKENPLLPVLHLNQRPLTTCKQNLNYMDSPVYVCYCTLPSPPEMLFLRMLTYFCLLGSQWRTERERSSSCSFNFQPAHLSHRLLPARLH